MDKGRICSRHRLSPTHATIVTLERSVGQVTAFQRIATLKQVQPRTCATIKSPLKPRLPEKAADKADRLRGTLYPLLV